MRRSEKYAFEGMSTGLHFSNVVENKVQQKMRHRQDKGLCVMSMRRIGRKSVLTGMLNMWASSSFLFTCC